MSGKKHHSHHRIMSSKTHSLHNQQYEENDNAATLEIYNDDDGDDND